MEKYSIKDLTFEQFAFLYKLFEKVYRIRDDEIMGDIVGFDDIEFRGKVAKDIDKIYNTLPVTSDNFEENYIYEMFSTMDMSCDKNSCMSNEVLQFAYSVAKDIYEYNNDSVVSDCWKKNGSCFIVTFDKTLTSPKKGLFETIKDVYFIKGRVFW